VPGLFGRIAITGSAPYRAALVPDEAIGTDQDRRIAMVVSPDGTVRAQPVRLGPAARRLPRGPPGSERGRDHRGLGPPARQAGGRRSPRSRPRCRPCASATAPLSHRPRTSRPGRTKHRIRVPSAAPPRPLPLPAGRRPRRRCPGRRLGSPGRRTWGQTSPAMTPGYAP
jgi:hypothetical protein